MFLTKDCRVNGHTASTMEMTPPGKRRRASDASVDDAALLQAVETVDPERGSAGDAPRRWQQVAESVAADTGADASGESCRKRYEELTDGNREVIDVSGEDGDATEQKQTPSRDSGEVPAKNEPVATTEGGETTSRTPLKTPAKATPSKTAGAKRASLEALDPLLSLASPAAKGKKRKTSLSPAALAREKRNSLLARVKATRHRHEKRLSINTPAKDIVESLAVRVARKPQDVRVTPVAIAIAKASPIATPGKPRQERGMFSPKATRPKSAVKDEEVASSEMKKEVVSPGEDRGEEAKPSTSQRVLRARRPGPNKVVQALEGALAAAASGNVKSRGDKTKVAELEEKTAAVTLLSPASSRSSRTSRTSRSHAAEKSGNKTSQSQDERSPTSESAVSPGTNRTDASPGEGRSRSSSPAITLEKDEDATSIKDEVQPDAHADTQDDSDVAMDEDPEDVASSAGTIISELNESFASREEMVELQGTVATLASSLAKSKSEQEGLKRDLASTQKCLRVCDSICLVLQQQVSTLTASLSDSQHQNAKLHEEIIQLREEDQHKRTERKQEASSTRTTQHEPAGATGKSLPVELDEIRETLRVHMDSVKAEQDTQNTAVAAGFGVLDTQLQKLLAAVDCSDKKREELVAIIDTTRTSFESQMKTYQALVEEEQKHREEVLATVEREREELERERRKQYQLFQVRMDEEQRKRDELMATFDQKTQLELERIRDVADKNSRFQNELLFKVKAERDEARTLHVGRLEATEQKMAALNESLIGVQIGLREHREQTRASKVDQQQALETLKQQVQQLQAALEGKSSEQRIKSDDPQDVYGLNQKIEALSRSLAHLQDSLAKQKHANKLRAMEQDSKTKIEWSELRKTLETERSERMRDFSKLLTLVRQAHASDGNDSE